MTTRESKPAARISSAHLRNTKQAATYLGLTHHTLEKWRKRGGGPRYVKFSNAVRYRVEDLDEFVESRLCANTSQQVQA